MQMHVKNASSAANHQIWNSTNLIQKHAARVLTLKCMKIQIKNATSAQNNQISKLVQILTQKPAARVPMLSSICLLRTNFMILC